MTDLPKTWVPALVDDVVGSADYGYTAAAVHGTDGPRYLRITDIQDDNVDWSTVPGCKIAADDLDRYRLVPGDLVFARTGATTGKSFLLRTCPPDSVYASYLIRLRPTTWMGPGFLAYFFQSPAYWQQISEKATGTAQPGVNATRLRELRLPVAPLPEQQRVVSAIETHLSRLDDAVRTLERVQRNRPRSSLDPVEG